MSHQFSMKTVLRRTPFKVLRWFLPNVGVELSFDWEKLHVYDIGKVIIAYEELPEEVKQKAEEVVREIVSLADQEGVAAMNDAAKLCNLPYWNAIFKDNPSAYPKFRNTGGICKNLKKICFPKGLEIIQIDEKILK